VDRRKTALLSITLLLILFSTALAVISREDILDEGLRNNGPYSYSLVLRGRDASGKERTRLIEEAIALSPSVPGLHFEMARAKLPNVFESINYIIEGVRAYGKSFYWSVNLAGLAYVSLMVSMAIAMSMAIFMRFAVHLPLLAHDIIENKAKLLLLPVALALSILGPAGFVLGGLFLVGFHGRKGGKALYYFAALLMLFSPVLVGLADTFYSTASPMLRAVVAVNEGRDNQYALQSLAGSPNVAARFSYATALKREGLAAEAADVFEALSRENPSPKVYTNLGNAYLAAGLRDEAKGAYEKALSAGRSAVALFNLSQVYRDELNYQTGDKYYNDALAVDRDLVTSFTAVAGKTPNRLVMDESLSKAELWSLAGSTRQGIVGVFTVKPLTASFAAALMLVLFVTADRAMSNRAYRCARCGKVVCEKCSGGKRPPGHICPDCYRAQTSPEDDNPRARVARMLLAGKYKSKQMDAVRGLSFAPPGIAQIFSGRVFSGFVYLWLFTFAIFFMVMNPLFSTGMGAYSHGWLLLPMGALAVLLYALSFMTVNRRLDQGWL